MGRLMAKPPKKANPIHNIPGLGAFTAAFAGNFSTMTDAELRDAFNKIDVDKSGLLDKTEIEDALKVCGKSDREITTMVDSMIEEAVDFEGFLKMVGMKPGCSIAFREWAALDDDKLMAKIITLDSY